MLKPGFKVFHIPDIDYLSSCPTLVGCLREIDRWSHAHPDHLPIMITINAADLPSSRPGIASPLSLDSQPLLDALNGEIRSVLPGKRLITPDEVRGTAPTLREAVRDRGWPSLSAARGRIFILLDVRAAVSDAYRAGHPSLAGRAMFGWYPDDQPEAAIQIVQDPLVDGEKIRRWVREGMIVRTRTDANTVEARARPYQGARRHGERRPGDQHRLLSRRARPAAPRLHRDAARRCDGAVQLGADPRRLPGPSVILAAWALAFHRRVQPRTNSMATS